MTTTNSSGLPPFGIRPHSGSVVGNSLKTAGTHRTRTVVIKPFDVALLVLMAGLWMPGPLSIGDVNLNIILAAPLGLWALTLPERLEVSKPDKSAFTVLLVAAIALTALATLSAFWADDPFRVTRPILAQAMAVVLLFAIGRSAMVKVSPRPIYVVIITCAIISSLLAFAGHFLPQLGQMLSGGTDRSAGLFKVSNQFGIALATIVPILVGYGFSARWTTLRFVSAVGVVMLGLAMSGSKTGMGAAAIAIAVAALVCLGLTGATRRNPFIVPIVIIAIVVGGWLFVLLLQELNPRSVMLVQQLAREGEIQSSMARERIWTSSIQIGSLNPWTGEGAGQRVGGFDYPHSHNYLLDAFRTLGIPGLFTTLCASAAVVGLAWSSLFDSRPDNIAARCRAAGCAVAALIYLATNLLSDSMGPSTAPIFWTVIALLFVERSQVYRDRLARRRASVIAASPPGSPAAAKTAISTAR